MCISMYIVGLSLVSRGVNGPSLKWYVFKVLPFGLASACYVFTKLLQPLVKQSKGLRCIVYTDDGICAATTKEECIVAKQMLLSYLEQAGFVLSMDKCFGTSPEC